MLLATTSISLTEANRAKPGHLLLCPGSETTLMWITEHGGDGPVAVFLNGAYARNAFLASEGARWAGVQIGPVELKVDPASAHTGRNSSTGLKAAEGQLLMRAITDQGGSNHQTYIKVGEAQTLATEPIYFERWCIGMQDGEQWRELVKFDRAEITNFLLPPADAD